LKMNAWSLSRSIYAPRGIWSNGGVAMAYERFGDAALTTRAHRSQFGGCAAAVKVRIRMVVYG